MSSSDMPAAPIPEEDFREGRERGWIKKKEDGTYVLDISKEAADELTDEALLMDGREVFPFPDPDGT